MFSSPLQVHLHTDVLPRKFVLTRRSLPLCKFIFSQMFFPCEFVHTRRPLFLINSFSYICLVLSYAGLSSFDVLFFFFIQVHPRMGVLPLEFVLNRRCSLLWIFLPLSGISQFGAFTPSSNEIQYLVFSKHGRENPELNFYKESDVV